MIGAVYIPNPGFLNAFRKKMAAATERAAAIAADGVRDSLQQPGSGVLHRGNPNQSSAPGEAPASQSGDLLNSIYSQPLEPVDDKVRAQYGSDLIYSRFLELGTVSSAPRPFIRPPIIDRKPEILAAFGDSL